jgi:hypothetical protein
MRAHGTIAFVAMAVSLACAGGHGPAGEAQPSSARVTGSTGVGAKDDGPPLTEPPAACSAGQGDPDAACADGGAPMFLANVDAAIDDLVAKRPELFDLKRVVGQNGYYVFDHDAFYLGVAERLQAQGLCAGWDLQELQVKKDQDHSEQYDLILSNGHIRRGLGSYRASCSPASFPLLPSQVIHRVRVAFYSIQCEDGRTPPRNGEGLLPVGCTGFVTATPKKKDDSDVDKRIHGTEIEWTLEQEDGQVVVNDFPKVDFNKIVGGRGAGAFRLCATVQTHQGCLNGTVIE